MNNKRRCECPQIHSDAFLENMPILQAFSHDSLTTGNGVDHNQLSLFNF